MNTNKIVMSALAVLALAAATYADGGTIKGVTRWEGKAPRQRPLKTDADPYCAQLYSSKPLLSEKRVINPNDTVRDVFIYVKSGLPDGQDWPVPSTPMVLDQEGCHYVPHVFGIMVGQELVIRNSDNTAHNVNCSPDSNTGFNQGQPKKGMEFTKTFSNPEMMIPFKCDVHPWMNAYCGVMEHPFFATTNDKGEFEIKNLPDGEYVIATWHEGFKKSQEMTVTISGGDTQEVEFVFTRPGRGKDSDDD